MEGADSRKTKCLLRARILVLLVSLLSLAVVLVAGGIFLEALHVMERDERSRIILLAQNLARDARRAVASQDLNFLRYSIESVLRHPTVLTVAVHDGKGGVLSCFPATAECPGLSDQRIERLVSSERGFLSEETQAGHQKTQEVIVPMYRHFTDNSWEEKSGTRQAWLGPLEPSFIRFEEVSETGANTLLGYVRLASRPEKRKAQYQGLLIFSAIHSGIVLTTAILIGMYVLGEVLSPLEALDEKLRRNAQAQRESREALERLRSIRSSLLPSLSHELRSPLTSIRTSSEILLTYPEEDLTTKREFLSVINRESKRLTRLINDIMDLARMDAGKMEWNMEEGVDVEAVVARAVQNVRCLLLKKDLQLEVRMDGSLPKITADEDRILQVLLNLLGNAIKFTPPGGEIRVGSEMVAGEGAQGGADRIRISVSDTGVGMPPEELPAIFEPFRQCKGQGKEKKKGSGLGLSISKEIVRHHGGDIWAESTSGEGSTFFVLLPVAGPVSDAKPALAWKGVLE
jgi:signal transduction histidine kinase